MMYMYMQQSYKHLHESFKKNVMYKLHKGINHCRTVVLDYMSGVVVFCLSTVFNHYLCKANPPFYLHDTAIKTASPLVHIYSMLTLTH